MDPVAEVRGRMMPLARDDIDADQIMPKQFLSRVKRVGYGEFVFHDWRRGPGFVFNDQRFRGDASERPHRVQFALSVVPSGGMAAAAEVARQKGWPAGSSNTRKRWPPG